MRRCSFGQSIFPAALIAVLAAGCATDDAATAAEARAKAQATWKLEIDNTDPIALERMDIYLVEDETEPEVFEIYGEDVVLVGTFPVSLHVGYDEQFDLLSGRAIPLEPSGGDPREPKEAWVRIDGEVLRVSGGSFTVEEITGKWTGSEGDRTLSGTIELRVQGATGERTLRGRFAVNGVTWG